MLLNTKKETKPERKPVQASDYGKPVQKTFNKDDKSKSTNTDGRKTLALWSN